MINWAAGRAPMPTGAPRPANVSALTSLPEYFNKMRQQQIGNARAAEAMEMRKQQMQAANAFREKQFEATQDYRNRSLGMQEKRLNQPPQPTTAQRDFRFGQQNPGFNEWQRSKAKAGAPNVNVNMPSQAKKFDEKIGGGFAEMAIEGMKGSRKARSEIQAFNMLRSALEDPNVHQGTGGETALMLKKGLQSLTGIPVEGVGTGEMIKKLSTQLALNEKDQLPGPLSNSDVRLLLSMPAGLKNTPEGNRLTIEMGILQREYIIARNSAMAKYYRANRGNIDPYTADQVLGQVDKEFTQKFRQFLPLLKKGGQELPPTSPLAGIPQLKSKAEFDAAPSGTVFLAPDGTQRVKP